MPETLSTPIERISEQIDKGDVGRPMPRKALQEAFADVYARTGSLTQACRESGISDPTGRKWLSDPRFVATVFKKRQAALSGEGASIGYRVLIEIATAQVLDSDGKFVEYQAPVSERRQAAALLLRLGGHNEAVAAAAAASATAAALHDLTEEQLQAHIAAARDTLLQLAGSGDSPRPPDVAHDAAPPPSLL